jgi:hypothetical protein
MTLQSSFYRDDPDDPMVALSFAVLHFRAARGFLIGLFSFAGNWLRPGSAFAPQVDE